MGHTHCRQWGDLLYLLERPSWLLASGHTLLSMIEYLYSDYSWIDDSSGLAVLGSSSDGYSLSFVP